MFGQCLINPNCHCTVFKGRQLQDQNKWPKKTIHKHGLFRYITWWQHHHQQYCPIVILTCRPAMQYSNTESIKATYSSTRKVLAFHAAKMYKSSTHKHLQRMTASYICFNLDWNMKYCNSNHSSYNYSNRGWITTCRRLLACDGSVTHDVTADDDLSVNSSV